MNSELWFLIFLTSGIIRPGDSVENFRLTGVAVPEHYDIEILTDLDRDFFYRGRVCIYLSVTDETSSIVLHSKSLKIFENETKLEETKTPTPSLTNNTVSRVKRKAPSYGQATEKSHSGKTARNRKFEIDKDKYEIKEDELVGEKPAPTEKIIINILSGQDGRNGEKTTGTTVLESVNESEGKEEQFGKVTTSEPFVTEETATNSGEIKNDNSTQADGIVFEKETPEESDTSAKPQSSGELENSDANSVDQATAEGIDAASVSHSPEEQSSETSREENFKIQNHNYHLENNFLTLNFDRNLVPGKKYRLHLKYEGVLTDTLTGFHRVPYTKKYSHKSTWLASTVFEPNEARSAFPCFDEPSLKATFDITLGHDKKYTALSNMPLKSTSSVEGKPDWQWSKFETTPRMSTYLVAFLISDLEYLTPRQNYSNTGQGTTYRFWARHDVLYKTRYAMRIAPDMKNYLENLLEVKEVLPKHDFVALPSFISTALENWGLYSFAEKNLLYSSSFSSIFNKFQITQVLGHEIAHMWFGNMVTPRWWDQIWLSEGFSNFFEVLASDHVQPNWDLKTISVVFAYLKLFSLDALHSSHPLVPVFKGPNDVNDIFDSISYQKGFYLVRMLNYTLGQEAFMNGVRKYLKNHLLSNADENDLWEVFNDCAHQEGVIPSEHHLGDIMQNWTRKTGYPILHVTRDYENHTATVTQRRFVRFKGDYEFRDNGQEEEEDDTKWWIPITYTSGSELNFRDTKPKIWLSPAEDTLRLTDMPSKNDFVLMNLDAAGMYRVNYDEKNWALLIAYLIYENYSEISVINRVQILDDLFDLARSGEVSYEKALDATNYLTREKHFLPWKAALNNFGFISRMFRSRDGSRAWKKFLRNLVVQRFDELGFESHKNESFSDSLNRNQIVKWACRTGLRQCTRKSTALFKKWMEEKKPDENNPVPANLRSVVYCTAIENGGSREWQFLWHRYLSNVVTDKTSILHGLGCTKNTKTLRKYLDWSLRDTSGIRKQDVPVIFKSVARNNAGFTLAKNFLKDRVKDITGYLGNNPFFLPQMIDALAAKMNQPTDLEDLEAIENQCHKNYRSAARSFKQAFERVRFNINWTSDNYKTITDWLKKQKL